MEFFRLKLVYLALKNVHKLIFHRIFCIKVLDSEVELSMTDEKSAAFGIVSIVESIVRAVAGR